MSKCISSHGEYSEHDFDAQFVCADCGAIDEDAASDAIHEALCWIDKTIDNVEGVPEATWRSDEVVEVLRELRATLTVRPKPQGSGSGG